jgi:lipoate-protein ligase A
MIKTSYQVRKKEYYDVRSQVCDVYEADIEITDEILDEIKADLGEDFTNDDLEDAIREYIESNEGDFEWGEVDTKEEIISDRHLETEFEFD